VAEYLLWALEAEDFMNCAAQLPLPLTVHGKKVIVKGVCKCESTALHKFRFLSVFCNFSTIQG